MKSVSLFFSATLLLLLSGCATFMEGSIDSTPDPTYVFNRSAPVVVTVASNAANSLQSKYYISRVVSALKSKGFTAVYTDNDYSSAEAPIKLVFFVDVDSRISSYTYQGTDYGTVQTGSTTNCNSYGYGNMGTANCTTTPKTSYGVVGHSNKTGYTTGHFFTLTAFDLPSNQKVLFALASSFNSGCEGIKIYDFLAEQALFRINFSQIIKQDFSVQMPDGYRCK